MDLAGTISVKSHKMQGNDFKTNCNPNGVTIPSALARANDDALVAAPSVCRAMRGACLPPSPDSCRRPAIATPFGADEMRARLAAADATDDASLMRALRDLRKRVMLRLIARDLGGLATLDEVMATMTALAEIAIAHRGRPSGREFALRARRTDRRPTAARAASCTSSAWASSAAGSSTSRPTSTSCSSIPRTAKPSGARRISNHEFFIRLARRADRAAQRNDRRRLRVPRRHAAAAATATAGRSP